MSTRVDFTGKTITDPEDTYTNCRFRNTVMEGRIAIVLDDCVIESLTLRKPEIVRLETRGGTNLSSVRIEKSTAQPLHWLKSIVYLKHRHQYGASCIRAYASPIRHTNKALYVALSEASREVERELGFSWSDFLVSVPKEVWDEAEGIFADTPEIRNHAVATRQKRWPAK